jgi:hypothetical protein
MRSGSTLLKALLGTNPEVSHVPEVHYGEWPQSPHAFYLRLWWLAREPVVVLKRPCFYSDVPQYPFVPPLPFEPIALIRNPVDTIVSLEKRVAERPTVKKNFESWGQGFLAYWCATYRNIHERLAAAGISPHVVFYEELLDDPVRVTEAIFRQLGVTDTRGVREYRPYGKWTWGRDDAGDKIKQLTVQGDRRERGPDGRRWEEAVRASAEAAETMRLYRNPQGRAYDDYLVDAGYLPGSVRD